THRSWNADVPLRHGVLAWPPVSGLLVSPAGWPPQPSHSFSPMNSPECRPAPPHATGTIHLVVPRRPGADLDLLRARLEGVEALQEHDVVWHIPPQRGDTV